MASERILDFIFKSKMWQKKILKYSQGFCACRCGLGCDVRVAWCTQAPEITCSASATGFTGKKSALTHDNKGLDPNYNHILFFTKKKPNPWAHPAHSAAQPRESLAGGAEGCGCAMEGLWEAPTLSLRRGAHLLSEQGASCLSPRVTRACCGS